MAGREGDDGETEALGSLSSSNNITVKVKFKGSTISVPISPQSTVGDLKTLLLPLTNILICGQKLIYKGKVLIDSMTLAQSEILNGSKVMLIAVEGLHQGDGPITINTMPNVKRVTDTSHVLQNKNSVFPSSNLLKRWKITGVVALSGYKLKAVPAEIWNCGDQIRVLNVSNNAIDEIPTEISSLGSLIRVFYDSNCISTERISWEGLSSLKSLMVLSFRKNNLKFLPSEIGAFTFLIKLDVSYNALTQLPEELGLLKELQIFVARNNRITSITPCIGNCSSLIEIDFSYNLLKELLEELGNLCKLKVLDLSNNGIKSLPSSIFKMCLELSTLNLHGTEITNDVLRQFEGWEDFDERRRKKHQKQLDFRVGHSDGFDEGAD